MSLTLEATHRVPLARNDDGSIRVIGSRITLDSIVCEFRQGASPEQIQEDFPSLTLRDIYSVIAYYLDNSEPIEAYLQERQEAAEQTRTRLESQPGLSELRQRIRARRGQSVK